MNNLEAALHYAETFGWAILPGHPTEKRPLVPRWQEVASSDPTTIRSWWNEFPNALVGINVGLSGLLVVDVDMHEDDDGTIINGEQSMARLAESLGHGSDWLQNLSVYSETGGGGTHHFFQAPAGVDFSKRKIGWLLGVDVLVGTSYCVLPPSAIKQSYRWMRDPDRYAVEELPMALWQSLQRKAGDNAQADGSVDMANLLAQGSRTGSRNNDLIRLIGWMRRTVGDDPAARAQIHAQLEDWRDRCDPPYRGGNTDEEFQRTLESGFGLEHDDRNPNWPILGDGGDSGALSNLSPFGLSEWLEPRVGARLRYHSDASEMMVWDGRRWSFNDANDIPLWPTLQRWHVLDQLSEFVDTQATTHDLQGNTAQANQLKNWLTKALDRRYFAEACLTVATRQESRLVNRDDLDPNPELLHCRNGVVDLTTGELLPHDPNLMNESLVPHDYNPRARSLLLEAQLESMFPGDPEMQAYLQRAVGVSLFGDNRAKALFVLRGEANTGKSTLLQALIPVLGAGSKAPYADAGDKKLFVAPKNDQHPAGLADALQYRLVLMSEEYGEKDKLNMPLLKAITGGDRLKARFMRQDFWSGHARCTPWMATNHDLRLDEFDEAVRTRLRLIDVPGVIPVERRRPNVVAELLGEAEGLLAWAIAGAVEFYNNGLQDPESVQVAVSEMVDEQDHVLRFVGEKLVIVDNDDIAADLATTTDVFHAYERWCAEEGARSLAKVQFIKRLKAHVPYKRRRIDGKQLTVVQATMETDPRNAWKP